MFLTRMQLNPARRGTRFLLSSPQRLHSAVLHGFPQAGEEQSGRVLWRTDQAQRHDLQLFVVSPREPDLTHLIEQAGWPTVPEATWQTKAYAPFLNRLEAGQRWAFRLRANPVKRKRDDTGRIHTIPHLTVGQQKQWLVDRAEGLGINFPLGSQDESTVVLTHRTSESFERRSAARGQGRDVTIASAQFDGVLEVTDPALLRGALVQGIGRAKAYGCGLMTLARP